MSERSQARVRIGVRAGVGALVIAVAVVGGFALSTLPLPSYEREPVAIAVDTLQGAEQSLVCAGSFAELGADPNRPSAALPVGAAQVTVVGETSDWFELSRIESGGSLPAVITAPAGEPIAAAQTQVLAAGMLRGLTASSCGEAVHEQWLLGGATTLGISTTLSLGNPTEVPATVQLTLFDENGRVDETRTSGVLVPARSEQTVSLNGYAPGRERISVRVVSAGAPVAATLGVTQTDTLSPFAVDTVSRQIAPSVRQVIPGVANISDHQHGPGDAGEIDPFPVVVRVQAPAGETGVANVHAMRADGGSEILGTVEFSGSAIAELPIAKWPEDANAVMIDADAPVLAAVLGSADDGISHDYAWFVPAPVLPADTDVAAAVVPGGRLVLANPGPADAEVQLVNAQGAAARPITVPAGAAVLVAEAVAAGGVTLSSTAPVVAGVRVAGGADIAGYPVLRAADRVDSIVVYPR